jgi:hypothetical protein
LTFGHRTILTWRGLSVCRDRTHAGTSVRWGGL